MKKTDDQLGDIAANYESRSHFSRADPANYMACYRRGLLDIVFGPPEIERCSEDAIIESAAKYSTRGEWAREDRRHYAAAKRRGDGFFEAVTGHMDSLRTRWSDDTITDVAKACGSQEAFRRLARGAWSAAQRRGMIPALKKLWEGAEDVA